MPSGYDYIHRWSTERLQVFLCTLLAMYSLAGVVLPLWEYRFVARVPWLLGIVAVCTAQSVVLGVALRLARRGRQQQSITLACIGNWSAVLLLTFIAPNLLAFLALLAMETVIFAEPYVPWRRQLAFILITVGCVLALAALARFVNIAHLDARTPRAIENAYIIAALPVIALHILVIVWNNAAALRVSENLVAERAAELQASRSRLITAADEERRRLERDLHDGAQQHLVALAVLVQLARTAGPDRAQPLLTEASGLVETTIAEIRRLAHGIYPPLLISGGLARALPAVAARAPIPVELNLGDLGRYPASTEAALYFYCSEALQNAAKHGGPDTTATITARADDQTLTLTISDTGRGFDPTAIGTGLTNMIDRVSAIGGHLVLQTAPGRGTRVTATVTSPAQPALARSSPR